MFRILPLIALLLTAVPVGAQTRVAPLLEAMGMSDMLSIMREEGLAYSETLERDMFPTKGGTKWQEMVSEIYDSDRMAGIVTDRMKDAFDDAQLERLETFFESALGQRIVGLELSARRAMLEEAVEEMSRENWRRKNVETDPRQQAITEFIDANDLIETNITGALNSNYAFYQGLAAGNALGAGMSDDDMLREVWAQEPEIRAETTEWVYSYLTLAYQPLSDDELNAYIELSKSPSGVALNAALFAAFDTLFRAISNDLGLGVSQFMVGEDI